MSGKIIYKDESYRIIGAAMDVHNELGCGFTEPVYQEALEYEFRLRQIPFEREMSLPVIYKGEKLNKSFRADFVCFDKIIVEIKAMPLLDEFRSQVYNYLKASGFELGLLINFGCSSLEYDRILKKQNWGAQS